MTRCNQFHFSHFFFHFYRRTGSITPAFIPRQLCLDIYAQASLPRHLFFDFSFFLLYGHFLWTVKENAPKFLSTQKGAGAPGFSSVLHRLLFSSASQPSKAHLLIVLVLAVRSAFLGAVLALVLLSIFRIILVGLFLCVIVLGHSALLFSPILFFHENQNAADNICRARKAVHPCCHHCLSCVYRH